MGEMAFEAITKRKEMPKNITHKELLTFSNLTHLDWHFIDVEGIKNGVKDYQVEGQTDSSNQSVLLKDLLSPETFVKRKENPKKGQPGEPEELKEEVYGLDDSGNYLGDDAALFEMRQKSGIAMEYLEKWQLYQETGGAEGTDEGAFLGDWEIVYGADNYKIVEDFLDELAGDKGKIEHPSREDCKDAQEALRKIEESVRVVSLVIDGVLVAVPFFTEMKVAGQYKPLGKGVIKELIKLFRMKEIKKEFAKLGEGLVSRVAKNKAYMFLVAGNEGSILLDSVLSYAKDNISNNLTEEERGKIEYTLTELSQLADDREKLHQDEAKITLTHKLSMFDTKFRVLVLKKEKGEEKEIVITYKLPEERRVGGVLPQEFELMNIVYNRIIEKYNPEEYNIRFAGYESGGELSLISSLQYDKPASIFCIKPYNLKGIVDFTEEDINNDYKDLLEITTVTGANFAIGAIESILLYTFCVGGVSLPLALLYLFIGSVFGALMKYWDSLKTEKILNILKSEKLGYIYKEKINGIEGFITEKYTNEESVPFTVNGDIVNVKKSDVLYYIFKESQFPNLQVLDNKTYYFERVGEKSYTQVLNLEKVKDKSYYKISQSIKGQVIMQGMLAYPHWKTVKFTEKEGEAFKNLLDAISKIQRNYISINRAPIETIYYHLDQEKPPSIEVTDELLEIEETGEEQEDKLLYINPSEYIFMPFIIAEGDNKGNIGTKLREDYIMSVVKSKIMRYKDYEKLKTMVDMVNNPTDEFKGSLPYINYIKEINKYKKTMAKVKYGLEDKYQNYSHDFDNQEINQYIVDLMKNRELSKFINKYIYDIIFNDPDKVFPFDLEKFDIMTEDEKKIRLIKAREPKATAFNYQDLIVKELENNPQLLEKCYKLENEKQVRKPLQYRIVLMIN